MPPFTEALFTIAKRCTQLKYSSNAVHNPQNGAFSHKKEPSTDICNNINEPGKHYTKLQKTTLQDPIYMKSSQWATLHRKKVDEWLLRAGGVVRE